MEIKKILQRDDGVKYVIVPKQSKMKKGDYVKLILMEVQTQ